jgi:hypothetical protein
MMHFGRNAAIQETSAGESGLWNSRACCAMLSGAPPVRSNGFSDNVQS